MTDPQFLLDLARRLGKMQEIEPNVHLHWFDITRLNLAAAKLEADELRLRGMERAISALLEGPAGDVAPKAKRLQNLPEIDVKVVSGDDFLAQRNEATKKAIERLSSSSVSLLKPATRAPVEIPMQNTPRETHFIPKGFA